jgi:hypothetical protein
VETVQYSNAMLSILGLPRKMKHDSKRSAARQKVKSDKAEGKEKGPKPAKKK